MSHYIEATRVLRGTESALFISCKKTHNKVSVHTISRWLKQVLESAGIDTDKFKSHSTRAASTSAARAMDVHIDHILVAAGWSSELTFQKFYHKLIARLGVFAESVLSSVI